MRFSYSWLKSHLDTKATPDEIAERLTAIGLEVEKVISGKELTDLIVKERAGKPISVNVSADDPIFEVNVMPNRPDWAGVYGIARDLAASGLGKLKPLNVPVVKGIGKSPIPVQLDFSKELSLSCRYFAGRYIRGVKNRPSPDWMQQRLLQAGLRPISALVDITNFLTFDLCRPGHVFDARKIDSALIIRSARANEKFKGLDGKDYTLVKDVSVLADKSKILGLAGVLGGEESGCDDDTTDVLLEIAYFDPGRTAVSGREMQIMSDARYRFERGVDPDFLLKGEAIATGLILELCGGEPSEPIIVGTPPEWKKTLSYRPSRMKSFGGLDVSEKEQKTILGELGFDIKEGKDSWSITPPSWRGDVSYEADIIEEILRMKGYDAVPAEQVMPLTPLASKASMTIRQERQLKAQRVLASRGLYGCVTWSFLAEKDARHFAEVKPELRIKNPISSDLDYMRSSILPNLVQAAARNAARGYPNAALFEIGPVFHTMEPEGQKLFAKGVRTGQSQERHWALKAHDADLYDVKADVLALLDSFGFEEKAVELRAGGPSYFHPGRSATVLLRGNVIGSFGTLNPAVLQALDVHFSVAAFELDLDALPDNRNATFERPKLTLLELQPLERDFAFLVDEGVASGALISEIEKVSPLVASARVFDVYRGKGVPDGKKSLALSVTLQSKDKPLTQDDIQGASDAIVKRVVETTGAQLR